MGLLFIHLEFIHVNLSFDHLCFLRLYCCQVSLWNQPRHHGAANRERKLTLTVFTVTSLSLLFCLPFIITFFLLFPTNILSSLSEIALFRLYCVSIFLLYANSFLNPILYTMRMPGFGQALKMLCRQRPQTDRQVQIIPLPEINQQTWI